MFGQNTRSVTFVTPRGISFPEDPWEGSGQGAVEYERPMTSLRRRVGGAAAAVAMLAMVVAGSTAAMSADAAPSGLPASLHGAVETKAMTFGTGVPPSGAGGGRSAGGPGACLRLRHGRSATSSPAAT